jgi:hypothetical protein
MEHDTNGTACMIGKAPFQPYPKSKEHALERVYMDIMTSSFTSLERYDYALIITDDESKYIENERRRSQCHGPQIKSQHR